MTDPHPSSDVLERLEAFRPQATLMHEAAALIEAQAATIERLSAQLEQAARVDEAMIARVRLSLEVGLEYAIEVANDCKGTGRMFDQVMNNIARIEKTIAELPSLSVLPVIGG